MRNGDLWDVQHVGADGSLTVIPAHTRSARRGVVGTTGSNHEAAIVLPAGYVADHVDLAYATTTHRAQGITVDRAHVLTHAGMSRENLYVAMTRGRETNHLYVAVDTLDTDCDVLPDPHAPVDAHDILATILATSGAEQSATATIAARQDHATSLRRLEPIARTLYADAAQARWTGILTNLDTPQATIDKLTRSPDAGRLFTALDQVAAITADPHAVARWLSVDLGTTRDPAGTVLAGARTYLRRQAADTDDMPTIRDATGLDPDGQDLLDRVNRLIDDRVHALTAAALDGLMGGVDGHRPEPSTPAAHEAWLAAIGAAVAHDDRVPVAPSFSIPKPTAAISR